MSFRSMLIRISAFTVMLTLSACTITSGSWIIRDATRFNAEVERAQNEMLLLNILRMRDRAPFYLSSINQVRGNLTLSSTLPNEFALSGPNNGNKLWPPITATKNPSFDLSLLDNTEFYKGFLAPISGEVIVWYQNQGWPSQLLWNLIVAEFTDKNGVRYRNWPITVSGIETFRKYVNDNWYCPGAKNTTAPAARACNRATFSLKPGTEEVIPVTFTPQQARETEWVGAMLEKGYAFKPVPGGLQLRKSGGKKLTLTVDNDPLKDGSLVYRSPYGVMFYLGDLINYQTLKKSAYKIKTAGGKCSETLFTAEPVMDKATYDVVVNYQGTNWGIPTSSVNDDGCRIGGGRSMNSLALLSHLIGLQKKSDKLPTTPAVVLN